MESVNSTKRRTGDLRGSARGKKRSDGGTGALKEDLHRGGRLANRCGMGMRARAPGRLAFTSYKKKCRMGRVARKKEGYEKTGRLLGLNEKKMKRRRSGCTGALRYLCSLLVIREVVPL